MRFVALDLFIVHVTFDILYIEMNFTNIRTQTPCSPLYMCIQKKMGV